MKANDQNHRIWWTIFGVVWVTISAAGTTFGGWFSNRFSSSGAWRFFFLIPSLSSPHLPLSFCWHFTPNSLESNFYDIFIVNIFLLSRISACLLRISLIPRKEERGRKTRMFWQQTFSAPTWVSLKKHPTSCRFGFKCKLPDTRLRLCGRALETLERANLSTKHSISSLYLWSRRFMPDNKNPAHTHSRNPNMKSTWKSMLKAINLMSTVWKLIKWRKSFFDILFRFLLLTRPQLFPTPNHHLSSPLCPPL